VHRDLGRPMVKTAGVERDAGNDPSAAVRFEHGLDCDLFALDRLDHLLVSAPGHDGQVKLADSGLERPDQRPRYDRRMGPLDRDLFDRRLHVHIYGVHVWGPPELRAACDELLSRVAPAGDCHKPVSVIRVFSPGVPWPYHAEGEHYVNCAIGGRNVWHVRDRAALDQREHEGITHGRPFFALRDRPEEVSDLAPGEGFVLPGRFPHYVEHPGDEPAVSLCVGWWTRASIAERKVHDVNYALRRLRLAPAAPGHVRRDAAKRRAFDTMSFVTGKGRAFRRLHGIGLPIYCEQALTLMG
jgi:hypothetical protein